MFCSKFSITFGIKSTEDIFERSIIILIVCSYLISEYDDKIIRNLEEEVASCFISLFHL